tara:strand:- start:1547 stop:1972 length:426 start_codon:yes stop_codon:yes gene_type:complete
LTSDISNKDKKDWEDFISNNETIPNKEQNNLIQKIFKTKTIDLHGYSLEEANKSIENFIYESYEKKVNKLIVVTGKGLHSHNEKNPYLSKDLSILKYSVPEFIQNNKDLMNIINEIKEANVEDGGSGAFYILLKRNRTDRS